MIQKIILISILLTASYSQAGFIKGNGGNTVVCTDSKGRTTTQLLDFTEASFFVAPDTLHFTNFNGRTKEKILADVLQTISSVAFEKPYAQWLADFEKEAVFLKGTDIGVVPDSFHYVVPKDCVVEQTVVQIEPVFHEARYTINQDRWDQLAPGHQAGLKMHELIYRDLQSDDSIAVRMINSFLFSDEILKMTLEQKKSALKNLGFIKSF